MTTDTAALDAIRAQLQAAENAGDADALAALMADDVVLMVPDFDVREGRDACAAFVRETVAWTHREFDRTVVYTSAEVRVDGTFAFDRGTFSFTVVPKRGGAAEAISGKYLWLYSRATDGWKLARVIVSVDEQQAATEEA